MSKSKLSTPRPQHGNTSRQTAKSERTFVPTSHRAVPHGWVRSTILPANYRLSTALAKTWNVPRPFSAVPGTSAGLRPSDWPNSAHFCPATTESEGQGRAGQRDHNRQHPVRRYLRAARGVAGLPGTGPARATLAGVVVQFAIKKPGFFGKAGLLMVELYHHPCGPQVENGPLPR